MPLLSWLSSIWVGEKGIGAEGTASQQMFGMAFVVVVVVVVVAM